MCAYKRSSYNENKDRQRYKRAAPGQCCTFLKYVCYPFNFAGWASMWNVLWHKLTFSFFLSCFVSSYCDLTIANSWNNVLVIHRWYIWLVREAAFHGEPIDKDSRKSIVRIISFCRSSDLQRHLIAMLTWSTVQVFALIACTSRPAAQVNVTMWLGLSEWSHFAVQATSNVISLLCSCDLQNQTFAIITSTTLLVIPLTKCIEHHLIAFFTWSTCPSVHTYRLSFLIRVIRVI